MGQHFDLADLVAVHRDLHLDGPAEAFAFADVLIVGQGRLGGGSVLGRGLHVAKVDVQQLGGLFGHVGADAAAAGQTLGVAHLGDAGGIHKDGDAVGAVDALGHGGGLRLDLRLIDGQVGGGVPAVQFLGDGRSVIGGAHQADDGGCAAQRAAQGADAVTGLAVDEHLSGNGGVGEAHLLLQLGQQSVGDGKAAAVLIEALVAQLLHPVQIELTVGVGMGRDGDIGGGGRGGCLRGGGRGCRGGAGRLGAAGQAQEGQASQGEGGLFQKSSAGFKVGHGASPLMIDK